MTPLVKATEFKADEKLIQATARNQNISLEEARALLDAEIAREGVWVNEKYQVSVTEFNHKDFGPCTQINIRRRDGNVIFRDWREFQEIKNQLAGPEVEGLELYPAESRNGHYQQVSHILYPQYGRWGAHPVWLGQARRTGTATGG